ncbi:MAG: DUF4129 domain-containing protein [Anaerolineales bacterium]|nr:DUF4129 domain-containing protein [Anaerolineales bacterium]
MNAAGEWILKRTDTRGLLKPALLAAVLAAAVGQIAPLIVRADAALFLSAALCGLLAGWLIGRLPLPPAAAAAANAALGIDFLLLTVGRLDLPFRRWIGLSAVWFARFLPQFRNLEFDAASWRAETGLLLTGPSSVVARFFAWAASIRRGDEIFDPVASAFFWGLVFFLLGAFAGWALSARRKPFAAVLPPVILSAGVSAALDGDWPSAVVIAGLAMAAVIVAEHILKEEEWDRRGMGYSTGIRWDLSFSAGPVLAFLLLAAYTVPAIPYDDISRWIREHSQPAAAPADAGGRTSGEGGAVGPGVPRADSEFPLTHYLGAGPDLTREVVLVIVTGETLKYFPGMREPSAPHHYWKAVTYDIYTGSAWLTGATEEREMLPGERIREELPFGVKFHQAVTVNRYGSGPLYAAGEVVTVDTLFRVVTRTWEDVFGILVPGSSYEVDSVYTDADVGELRAAGTDYPQWIRGRYLQLPRGLPQRVHILARDLTAAPATPYDRAVAIQEYLRAEMRYSLDVEAPPRDRDVVDFFLFDSREGFCDYYATAMAVLARSAGIPARIAFGYASGTFDSVQGKFTVLESDAHAWPELYFPGIGWVEFEPTSSMAMIRREEAPAASEFIPAAGRENATPAVLTWIGGILRRMSAPALILLVSLPTLALAWILLAPFRYWFLAPAAVLPGIYRELATHGRRQGVPRLPSTTPAEFAHRLARINPGRGVDLHRIVDLYSMQVYGGKPITAARRREAAALWPGLDRGLWINWWNRWTGKWRNVFRRRARSEPG